MYTLSTFLCGQRCSYQMDLLFFIHHSIVNVFIGKRCRGFKSRLLLIVIQAYMYISKTGVCTCRIIYHIHFHSQIMQKSLYLYLRHTKYYIIHIMFLSVNLLSSAKRSTDGRITIFPPTTLRRDNNCWALGQKYIKVWACPIENGAYDNFFLWNISVLLQILYVYSVCAN